LGFNQIVNWNLQHTNDAYSALPSLCPSCGKSFSRLDALKRHMAEQKHGPKSGGGSDEDFSAKEYFCPNAECERTRPGSGFKRQAHVREHIKNGCSKLRLDAQPVSERPVAETSTTTQLIEDGPGPELTSSMRSSEPGLSTVHAQVANEGAPATNNRRLAHEDKISSLEECLLAEEEELRVHEEEGRRRRERLARLRGLIEMFREGGAVGA